MPLLFAHGINRFCHDMAHMLTSSIFGDNTNVNYSHESFKDLFPLGRQILEAVTAFAYYCICSNYAEVADRVAISIANDPHHEKTCLQGL